MQRRNSPTRLNLEAFDDRIVPSVVDLTTHGAEGAAGSALVRQTDAQPTGTGYIKSFVRVQAAASGSSVEQGYNTTARPLQFDENSSPSFTRALTLGEVPMVVVNGVTYREFLLDINQKSSSPNLSVDEIRLFLGGTSNLTGYNATTKQLAGLDAIFDMDAGGDNAVKLNARLNSGSGSGDMFLLVPNTAFAGHAATEFVYLYSKMGGSAQANGGFEEWAVRSTGSTATGGTASLSGFVYVDLNNGGTRDTSEPGIAGVTITLQGVDDLGQTVVLTTTTDSNGAYTFGSLRAGTYSLIETQPLSYVDASGVVQELQDGTDTIGSQGGSVAADRFHDIFLAAGVTGVDNNFGEKLLLG